MNTRQLINELQHYQALVFDLCQQDKNNYRQQYHSGLSPTGWHLGHCIYTESYWIREMFLEQTTTDDALATLYNPVLSDKTKRGESLPDYNELCIWAKKTQSENLRLLDKYHDHQDRMKLMHNNFLLYFLIQHYAQHFETIQITKAQANLNSGRNKKFTKPLQSVPLGHSVISVNAGTYHIGANGHRLPYDNEYPGHSVDIEKFDISIHPVTNAEYLLFMEQGGYDEQDYWTESGWKWLQQNKTCHPEYWQPDNSGNWYELNHHGYCELPCNEPVYGLSHFESEAFAKWAGARLPHEHEWEVAFQSGRMNDTGKVWEWCSNTLYPYSGFTAYPYDGYSVPYFDGKHNILKGGSCLTQPVIKRPSFRNYYVAETRFMYAGIRLVFT